MWSGAARSTPINDKTDRKKPSAWRKGTRKTRRSVNAVSIAQSENVFGAPGRPDGDRRHASVASAESHSVTSPRWTKACSYADQFPRDTSPCTSDGPLISCRDRAPAAVTVAREPTAASSQPKGCAPTPRCGATPSGPASWIPTCRAARCCGHSPPSTNAGGTSTSSGSEARSSSSAMRAGTPAGRPSRSTGSGQSPVLRENGRGQARPVLRGDRNLA